MSSLEGLDDMILEEISETECRKLLAGHHFGRISVVSGGAPLIFPVNYFYEDEHVAIRTGEGTKLSAAVHNRVAFEIDEIDTTDQTGWSVLVTGTAYEVTNAMDFASHAMRRLDIEPWAPGRKSQWIRIDSQTITGRRLRPGSIAQN